MNVYDIVELLNRGDAKETGWWVHVVPLPLFFPPVDSSRRYEDSCQLKFVITTQPSTWAYPQDWASEKEVLQLTVVELRGQASLWKGDFLRDALELWHETEARFVTGRSHRYLGLLYIETNVIKCEIEVRPM